MSTASVSSDAIPVAGPLLVGFMIHWCLFSTLCVQIYIYYEGFMQDRTITKCLVYGVFVMEFIQTILVAFDAFSVFAFGFGDLVSLTAMHYHWLTVPIMSGLVAFTSQVFYAYRIYVLSSRSRIVPAIIIAIALLSTAGGFVTGILARIAGDITQLNSRAIVIAITFWCGGAAVCDILIAIYMTFYLSKNDTGFRHPRRLIARLIRITVETGTLTAVAAIVDLVLFYAFPGGAIYTAVALILPKLYANAMIMVLNARLKITQFSGPLTEDFHSILPSHIQFGTNTTETTIREVNNLRHSTSSFGCTLNASKTPAVIHADSTEMIGKLKTTQGAVAESILSV
ncbi:hypothetical protein BDZ89DRAFT_1137395 [Hymenopellis radicata]|nr:hypothetical protein BDZ89DRAFT_1137395 [Hymenopellis radicata]